MRLRLTLACVALAAASCGQISSPVAGESAVASASPTPLTLGLSVPDSTPIITFADPAKPGQLDGITWDGVASGKLDRSLADTPNPSASLFATATEISDRSGRTLFTGTFGAKFFTGMWADDDVHLCQVVPFDYLGANEEPTTLQLVSADGTAHNVARVGSLSEQTSIGLAACSVLTDRAIVVQRSSIGGAVHYWVVQLSTGRVLWAHDFQSTTRVVQVVASRDGMFVAENPRPDGQSGSTVYGADGKQVAQLPAEVEAFSWDGSLAVVDAGYGTAPVQVVSWRDGSVTWSAPSGYGLVQAKPRPGGGQMALWVQPVARFQSQAQGGDLFVVTAAGKVVFHIANTA
jgi:hypothetical protein